MQLTLLICPSEKIKNFKMHIKTLIISNTDDKLIIDCIKQTKLIKINSNTITGPENNYFTFTINYKHAGDMRRLLLNKNTPYIIIISTHMELFYYNETEISLYLFVLIDE